MPGSAIVAVLMGFLCLGAGSAQAAPPAHQVAQLVAGAVEQTGYTRLYDPAYVQLAYPGGDPPPDRGVCSDVVVRAFRRAGVDLQKDVHEDMVRHFGTYPNQWHLRAPDPNIDHRRVPNLMTFFTRMGKSVPISKRPEDYVPGDIVAWDLGNGVLHIGMVTDRRAPDSRDDEIVHNIGAGARLEDVLFSWTIIGHYRYF